MIFLEEMTAFGKIVGVWITCFVTAALPWIGLGRFEHLNKDTVMCLIDLEQWVNVYYRDLLA